MDGAAFFSAQKIFKRMLFGVVFALIYFTCRNAVAKHFFYKNKGHFDRAYPFSFGVIVCPVFEVMAVSALVVKPGRGIAKRLPLGFIRTAVTFIKFCPF